MQSYSCVKIVMPDQYSGRVPRGPVHGITALGNRLFVIRDPNKQHLEAYDSAIFTLETKVYIPGMHEGPYSITSCELTSCVYLSDCDQMHTIKLSADGRSHSVTTWTTSYGNPVGLDLDQSTGSLLVTCRGTKGEGRLLQYSLSSGTTTMIQEIRLPDEIIRPLHSVRMSGGLTAVVYCRGPEKGAQHRLCTVGDDGMLINQHTIKSTPLAEDCDEPGGLAVLTNGNFLIADVANSRVLVIGSSLTKFRELLLRVDGGLRRPFALCLDESHGRLYIGEFTSDGRILVFDNVFEVAV